MKYRVVGANGFLWATGTSLESSLAIAREEAEHDVFVIDDAGIALFRCYLSGDWYVEETLRPCRLLEAARIAQADTLEEP
jgi:hypothetical protein